MSDDKKTTQQQKESQCKKAQKGLLDVPQRLVSSRKLVQEEKKVQIDNIWKDVVRHEKLLIKLWNWKWDFLVSPSQSQLKNTTRFPEIFIDKAIATRKNVLQVQGNADSLLKIEVQPGQAFTHRQGARNTSTIPNTNGNDEGTMLPFKMVLSQSKVPLTSAGQIGWLLTKQDINNVRIKNSFDSIYPTKSTHQRLPKIRFVKEEYGEYRKLKYLKENMHQRKEHEEIATKTDLKETSKVIPGATPLPSKSIRYKVNPLLC